MPIEQRWKDIGVQIPSLLPLQAVPQEWDEPKILEYLQSLHNYLREDRQKVVRSINVLSRYRLLISDNENFPDPSGSGCVCVDEDDGTMYVDPPSTDPSDPPPPSWAPIVPEYNTITQEPTGFLNSNQDTNIGIDGTGKFYIEPSGTSFIFYSGGIKYEVTSRLTLDISSATTMGNYWIVFNGQTGALTLLSSVVLEDIIRDNVFVAEMYHDGTSLISLQDERHGLMPWQAHLHAHLADGTVHRSGLGLTNMVVDGDGNTDAHAEVDAATGQVMDEDIIHTLPTMSPGNWDIIYMDSGGYKVAYSQGAAPVILNTGVPQYNDVSTPGAETLTDVDNNKFFLMHIFATNFHTQGDGTSVTGHAAIVGQNQYLTKTLARTAATTEISSIVTGNMPTAEFVPQATIIFKRTGTNAYNCAVVSSDAAEDYVNWLGAEIQPGNPPSSHMNLTNRDAIDQHPLSALEGGSSYPFPDDAYFTGDVNIVGAANPSLVLREGGSTSNYSFIDDQTY
jgi:hypothetical protein